MLPTDTSIECSAWGLNVVQAALEDGEARLIDSLCHVIGCTLVPTCDSEIMGEPSGNDAESTAPATEQAQPENDPNALSIGDLRGLQSIIDVASARGSFRANEMATVGAMYNKLQAFLVKVTPPQAPAGDLTSAAAPATAKK